MGNPEALDLGANGQEPEKEVPMSTHDEEIRVWEDEKISDEGVGTTGSDSDTDVKWTWKQIMAVISLCGVYVGK